VELRIVGYCPDRAPYERLAGNNPRIRFFEPIENEVAVEWMSRCRFFVLPSRTEAMGRVLLEAMAARRSIVASAVDGIPHYIEHEKNGLLFPVDDTAALAAGMTRLLEDPDLAARLGEEGCRRVNERFSEERYAEKFAAMVEATMKGAVRPRG
jgi:glycosyltransferase involved in cell wall biosynthesis